ncbi:hypothetical protein FA15DRAFT_665441 [Coprinopsis marcescibilis]|uniref:F-box domain-containing protein n=1 Tax=Coprinopsis marcescibilis TaxID=230819 RepID=A0A5C3L5B0_COPMA|nr:hypothetical protein FA15DRAFT_665441 [Coprinopsis marcescibilis]
MSILHDALPNELILIIATQIPGSASHLDPLSLALTQFALTCKRFYALLMPLVLEYHSSRLLVLESTHRLELYAEEEDSESNPGCSKLQDLMHNSHATTLCPDSPQLNCMRVTVAVMTPQDLWIIRGLVLRAKRLRGLIVAFDVRSAMPCNSPWAARKEWIRAFVALLDICLVNPGLTLTFEGQSHPFDSRESSFPFYHYFPRAQRANHILFPRSLVLRLKERVLLALKTILRFCMTFVRNGQISTALNMPTTSALKHPPVQVLATIRSVDQYPLSRFVIASNVPFSPSWYRYTEHILRHSSTNLAHLHLRGLDLSLYDWHIILPSWNFARLLTLELGKSAIAFPDLLAFLCRHPSITALDLTSNVLIGRVELSRSSKTRRNFLPKLEQISASPDYLVPFLTVMPPLFPLLRAIVVDAPVGDQSRVDEVSRLVLARPAGGNVVVDTAKRTPRTML